jgi:uncharacterized membrane protein YgcG
MFIGKSSILHIGKIVCKCKQNGFTGFFNCYIEKFLALIYERLYLFQIIKMKSKFLLLVFLFIAILSQAQPVTGCGFKVPPRSLIKANFKSVYEAKEILKNMLDTVKWKENFSVREQNGIQNAYATIINRVRWIIYDNNFLEDIDTYTSTKWSSISILAHEMGHHFYNHVISSRGSTPPNEIEADAFSGYVMQKFGATLDQSVAAIKAIASDRASATHPAKNDRVTAITRGWNSAKAESGGGNTGGTGGNTGGTGGNTGGNGGNTGGTGGNTGGNGNTNTPPLDDPSWISLSIQSNKTEKVMLSDDGKNYQVAELKAGEPFVFRFEIYDYGWLRMPYYNGYRVYKLAHGKDYSILWNRRTKNWTVVEVPE